MTINWRILAGLAIAALFMWLALRQVDTVQAREVLRHTNFLWITAAIIMLVADYLIRSYRWLLMLRCFNPDLRLTHCSAPFWGSFAMNNILPLRAGDILRVVGYKKHLQVSRTHVAGTLIVERVYDMAALLTVLVTVLALLPAEYNIAHIQQLTVIALSLGVVGIGAVLTLPTQIIRVLDWLNARYRLSALLARLLELFRNILLSLVDINRLASRSRLIFLTACAWILEGFVFIFVLMSLGVTPAVAAGWLAMAAGTLSTLIPSSPGYAGTFDYFTALSLQIFSIGPTLSVLAAFTIHLVLWLPITLIGGIQLWRTHGIKRLQEIEK